MPARQAPAARAMTGPAPMARGVPRPAPRVGTVVGPARSVTSGHVVGTAAPRAYGYAAGPAYHYGSYYGGYHTHVYYAHPYYTFHSHFSLGFGLYVGYPVAYPYYAPYAYAPYYYYPYPTTAYPAPYPAYGYPATGYPAPGYPASGDPGTALPYGSDPGSVNVQPGAQNTGGLSFEITPGTAQIFVDGNYVGVVQDFTPSTAPLALTPGRHHVEVRAPGYQTIAFDADVLVGQVIPYQGTMQPLR